MSEIYNTFADCRKVLVDRLREPAPGRIQLLTGPRQVGKTTLLLDLAAQFGDRAVYAAGDEPDAALPGFWERRWAEAEARAKQGTAVLLLDEVHHLSDWAGRLKGEWDRARRRHINIHVVATGSSALRVATGSRESLAGRFERLTLSHWPAIVLADAFHLSPREAAHDLVRFGSYPGAVELQSPFETRRRLDRSRTERDHVTPFISRRARPHMISFGSAPIQAPSSFKGTLHVGGLMHATPSSGLQLAAMYWHWAWFGVLRFCGRCLLSPRHYRLRSSRCKRCWGSSRTAARWKRSRIIWRCSRMLI